MDLTILRGYLSMLKQKIISEIQKATQNLLVANQIDKADQISIHVEQPQHLEHGDLSTNLAMQLAKVFRKSPLHIAQDLVNELNKQDTFRQWVDEVEIVKPGFINFFLNWQALSLVENPYQSEKDDTQQHQKVIIEHTSINPNKAAHIGHLRNSCIGDTMARLYKFVGYNVEIHNYIDDLGNQLADTVVGLQNIPLQKKYDRFGDYCWDLYARINQAYQKDPSLQTKRAEVLQQLEEGDNNTAWQGYLVAEQIVREQIQEMEEFHINYDLLIWESDIVREGFWDQAFSLLRTSDQFIKENTGPLAGCWVLKQSDQPNQEQDHIQDKVLVRSNGILTYTAKDIAYHLWKFGLLNIDFSYQKFQEGLWTTSRQGSKQNYGHATQVLNVIDQRQEYPQQMVKAALETVGFTKEAENLHHVSYGVVSLSPTTASLLGIDTSDQKSSYTMSGRQGVGIKISELVEKMEQVIEEKRTRKTGLSSREIAIAAIRYYLLRFGLKTEIVFDMDQATEISGNTGVYLLYGYTRGYNILKKASVDHITKPAEISRADLDPAEYALIRHLITWPDTIESALKDLAPNHICNFAFELCSLFNHFYANCPVIQEEDPQKKSFRLWLTQAYLTQLADALHILGLPTPTEM